MDASSAISWDDEVAGCARRLVAGEVSALDGLFDRSAPRLLRYALALTHRREDAEDAVQAAFIRLAKTPQSLAAVSHAWAYLLKMVRNEALRVVARRRPMSALWEGLTGQPPAAVTLETAERDAEVQSALRRLPSDQAEVVVLKIWEEMTFQEIATVTGESLNTVASRYRYALAKLEYSLKRVAVEVGYVVQ